MVGNDTINKFVKRMAKWNGYKGDDQVPLNLWKMFPLAADKNTPTFGGITTSFERFLTSF